MVKDLSSLKYLKKILSGLFLFIFLIQSSFAISVQDTTNIPIPVQPQNTGMFSQVSINWAVIIPILIISIIVVIVLTIIFFIISKIIKKIRNAKKMKEDLEYYKYSLDLKNSIMNKNKKYKYPNFWFLFLLQRKAKIYCRTSRGRKFIGYYEGELVKKEGFFLIAIELRYSFFKREVDLIIFPYELADELVFFNQDGSIDLETEGIDEVLSSELFSLPVFKDEANKHKREIFMDFSDRVYKDYFKKFGDRKSHLDTIKDSAEKIRQSTEINPQIPFKRKTGDDLRGN